MVLFQIYYLFFCFLVAKEYYLNLPPLETGSQNINNEEKDNNNNIDGMDINNDNNNIDGIEQKENNNNINNISLPPSNPPLLQLPLSKPPSSPLPPSIRAIVEEIQLIYFFITIHNIFFYYNT